MRPLLPETLLFWPEMAAAALKTGKVAAYAAWAVLRRWDTNATSGAGFLRKSVAVAIIEASLQVKRRQAERTLAAGAGLFWEVTDLHVRLYSATNVADLFGIPHVTRGHEVPLADLASSRLRKATMLAMQHRTDFGDVPKTRRFINELTGVPASTQRRLDRQTGRTKSVAKVYASFGTPKDPSINEEITDRHRAWGFYTGDHGRLFRRHGDIRTAATHRPASLAPTRRLNVTLRARCPAMNSRGQRFMRAYFGGERPATAWYKAKRARGKPGSDASAISPHLNYALTIGQPRRGRVRTEVLRLV